MLFAALFLLAVFILDKIRPPELYSDETDEGETISVIGTVSDRYLKNNSQILEIQNAVISTELQKTQKNREKHGVLCYLAENTGELPRIGSDVVIRGKKGLFQAARNPGQFDYRMYEAIRGMDYCLFRAEIIRKDTSFRPFAELGTRLKERMGAIFEKYADEEDAGILKAMTLGDRGSLDPEIRELYRRAGIAHVLSISGLHISLLGYGLFKLLKRIGAKKGVSALIGVILMACYCMITGNAVSTVRAAGMFALCAIADGIGRTYDLLSALSLTLILMLLARPLLIHDSGFLLSFTAVLGIGLGDTIFKEGLGIVSEKPLTEKFLSGLRANLSVNLMTFPVTVFFFFQFSLLSPVLNMILVPFMGVLLLSSFSLALTGLIIPAAAFIPAALCHFILILYEGGCRICESIPGTILTAGKPRVLQLVIYYIMFAVLLFSGKKISEKPAAEDFIGKLKKTAYIIAVTVLPGILLFRGGSGLEITALDIGQGDCIYIKTPENLTMLIDCGSSSESSIARYRVVPFLRSRGVKDIDFCIVTHTDADHINGFEELFSMKKGEGVEVRCLLMPSVGDPDDTYVRLEEEAGKAGCQIGYLCAGETISCGKTEFRCLHPVHGFCSENKNTESVVMEMTMGDFSAVFTGDVQEEGEAAAAAALSGSCTLLKVAHHGSKNSSTGEFLSRASPKLAFISCGRKNRYGHPHAEALERIERYTENIFITAECGAVTLNTKDGRTIRVSGFISSAGKAEGRKIRGRKE
ncbi:MAG: DNA internalization-related competence protein ComEC/Rec2 [Lachnospiraceae bacterium]|nr:DNA internalization-related competence protein ComEC/Rec2 [Lachnospiraceae bacterium]